MSKSITIKTKEGQAYKLEFTKKTVAMMAKNGFDLDTARSNPIIGIPELFEGAFLANHKMVKSNIISEIYDTLPNKEALIQTLIEMYVEPINALIEAPKDDEGNGSWEVSE